MGRSWRYAKPTLIGKKTTLIGIITKVAYWREDFRVEKRSGIQASLRRGTERKMQAGEVKDQIILGLFIKKVKLVTNSSE